MSSLGCLALTVVAFAVGNFFQWVFQLEERAKLELDREVAQRAHLAQWKAHAETQAELRRVKAALDRAVEGFEAVRSSNLGRAHAAADEVLPVLRAAGGQ
jgi:hypothetical protein